MEATKGSELRVRGISTWFNTYKPYENPGGRTFKSSCLPQALGFKVFGFWSQFKFWGAVMELHGYVSQAIHMLQLRAYTTAHSLVSQKMVWSLECRVK